MAAELYARRTATLQGLSRPKTTSTTRSDTTEPTAAAAVDLIFLLGHLKVWNGSHDSPAAADGCDWSADLHALAFSMQVNKRTGWVLRNVQQAESIAGTRLDILA